MRYTSFICAIILISYIFLGDYHNRKANYKKYGTILENGKVEYCGLVILQKRVKSDFGNEYILLGIKETKTGKNMFFTIVNGSRWHKELWQKYAYQSFMGQNDCIDIGQNDCIDIGQNDFKNEIE